MHHTHNPAAVELSAQITYITKLLNCLDVNFIFLDFLSITDCLLNLQRVNVLGPTTFDVVHAVCFCLSSFSIYLKEEKSQNHRPPRSVTHVSFWQESEQNCTNRKIGAQTKNHGIQFSLKIGVLLVLWCNVNSSNVLSVTLVYCSLL